MLYGAVRQRGIQCHRAAGEIGGIEPAEYDRRVSNRGLFATPSIARRTRLGAGGVWADAQPTGAVDPGDRPTTSADCVDVDHRHSHRESGDTALCTNDRLAALHQSNVARRAADIDGDQVAVP